MKKGIGFYVRRMSERVQGTPAEFAAELASNGVSFVAFMGCWQDSHGTSNPNRGRIGPYARACADVGLDVWLWGFPRPDAQYLGEYFEAMNAHTEACGGRVRGWLHDPEVYWQRKGYKPGIGMRGQGEAISGVSDSGKPMSYLERAAASFVGLDSSNRKARNVRDAGLTSYGAARWFGLPWAQLSGLGFGSPQIYSADDREKVQGYLSDWRAIRPGYALRPSLPTYGANSGSERAILDHASRFLNADGSVPSDIHGFWFWSWEQTRGKEWNGVKALSERFL